MVRRAVPALLSLTVAVGVAGCGGGGSGPLPQRPPEQIVEAVAGALGKVAGYRVRSTSTDADGLTRTNAAVGRDGSVSATYVFARSTVSFVVTGDRGHVRGDAGYWRDPDGGGLGPNAARALAGQWVIVPGDKLVQEVHRLMPSELAHCLPRHLGTLTVGRRTRFGGRPVLVLRDAGDVPGGAPSEMLVVLDGPPLPLRQRQTGPSRAGGTFDRSADPLPGERTFTGLRTPRRSARRPARVVDGRALESEHSACPSTGVRGVHGHGNLRSGRVPRR